MPQLSRAEIDRELDRLTGWAYEDGAIRRTFVFPGFPAAIAFLQRLVPVAEAASHHPDITVQYRHVTLAYVTHDEGGVTLKDFDGAREADRLSGEA